MSSYDVRLEVMLTLEKNIEEFVRMSHLSGNVSMDRMSHMSRNGTMSMMSSNGTMSMMSRNGTMSMMSRNGTTSMMSRNGTMSMMSMNVSMDMKRQMEEGMMRETERAKRGILSDVCPLSLDMILGKPEVDFDDFLLQL